MLENTVFARWYAPTLNWGDALNPYLIHWLSGKRVVNVLYPRLNLWKILQRAKITKKPEYMVVGSILSFGNWDCRCAQVWGSGFLSSSMIMRYQPKAIHAVRGPLTREILIRQGFDCPDVYGDPALLVSKLYAPVIQKKYKIGIVPHYADKMLVSNFFNALSGDIKIIDVEQDFYTFIDEILSCEKILSSSLHGIIAASAYSIPSKRIRFSSNIAGGDFKYNDYYLGIGASVDAAHYVGEVDHLLSASRHCDLRCPNSDQIDRLFNTCPFLK